MTITAPTLDTITGNTVMVKMRELIKQMTVFAKEVADLVNTIPTDIQDTYSREAVDEMIDEVNSAITTLSGSVYNKTEVYTKNEVNQLNNTKQDTLIAGNNITIENNVISAIGGSGGMVKIKSETPSESYNSITVNQNLAGLYIINIPTHGGIYILPYVDADTSAMSSTQYGIVEYSGSNVYNKIVMFNKISTDTNSITFRANCKYAHTTTTATWVNETIPANTKYEVYFIPTLN